MSKRIGQVIAVAGATLSVEVDPTISDLHVRHDGTTYTVGQPGSYLIIDAGHDKHLMLTTMVRKSQWSPSAMSDDAGNSAGPASSLPAGHFPYLPLADRPVDRTVIDGVLVGTISGKVFEVGVGRLPVVGDVATLALESHLRLALAPPEGRSVISLGEYTDSHLPVYLDLDNLLGKHTAIVGTTGCGKSYTVAALLHEVVARYPGANVVVFDLHGEYRDCFATCRYLRADRLTLPAWLHSFDDLFHLCADLSNQFNIHNQRWAFRDAIFQLKQRFCIDVLKDAKLAQNIDLDAPLPYDFVHLQNFIHNLNNATVNSTTDAPALESGETEEWFTRQMKFKAKARGTITGGPLNGDLDRLVLRIDSRARDPRYGFIFRYSVGGATDFPALVREISGFMGKDSSPITIFDLSYLPSETVGAVVATISRLLFQVHFLSERVNTCPSLVVYEEAHNYISRSGSGAYGEARQSVERIAKEGRKFGIGTVVVSQRPSELSDTLLSQCNTFLCMRLANSGDKNQVLGVLPDSFKGLVEVLPALPRGHVVAIGQASKMPVRFVVPPIEQSRMRPASDDPRFGEHWAKRIAERLEPNIDRVCDCWVRAEKPGADRGERAPVDPNTKTKAIAQG
jgi:hypothetical protein